MKDVFSKVTLATIGMLVGTGGVIGALGVPATAFASTCDVDNALGKVPLMNGGQTETHEFALSRPYVRALLLLEGTNDCFVKRKIKIEDAPSKLAGTKSVVGEFRCPKKVRGRTVAKCYVSYDGVLDRHF